MEKMKKPLGLLVLANLNLFFFGAISLITFYYLHTNISGSGAESFMEDFRKFLPAQELTIEQFRALVASQIIISVIFIISGAGLLKVKEWARRMTIYFSFFMVALVFVSVIFSPSLIGQAILQIMYPGALILYFTNKEVESFFSPKDKNQASKEVQN